MFKAPPLKITEKFSQYSSISSSTLPQGKPEPSPCQRGYWLQNSIKRMKGMNQVGSEDDEGEQRPTGHSLSLEKLRASSGPTQPEAISESNSEERSLLRPFSPALNGWLGSGGKKPGIHRASFFCQLPRAWREARLPAPWSLGMCPSRVKLQQPPFPPHPGEEVLVQVPRPQGEKRLLPKPSVDN